MVVKSYCSSVFDRSPEQDGTCSMIGSWNLSSPVEFQGWVGLLIRRCSSVTLSNLRADDAGDKEWIKGELGKNKTLSTSSALLLLWESNNVASCVCRFQSQRWTALILRRRLTASWSTMAVGNGGR